MGFHSPIPRPLACARDPKAPERRDSGEWKLPHPTPRSSLLPRLHPTRPPPARPDSDRNPCGLPPGSGPPSRPRPAPAAGGGPRALRRCSAAPRSAPATFGIPRLQFRPSAPEGAPAGQREGALSELRPSRAAPDPRSAVLPSLRPRALQPLLLFLLEGAPGRGRATLSGGE